VSKKDQVHKMKQLTLLIALITSINALHADKTREEAKREALEKIDVRYDIKEAKASARLIQKKQLAELRRKQRIELLNVELDATKNTENK
jgi:hypothetical protein